MSKTPLKTKHTPLDPDSSIGFWVNKNNIKDSFSLNTHEAQ